MYRKDTNKNIMKFCCLNNIWKKINVNKKLQETKNQKAE